MPTEVARTLNLQTVSALTFGVEFLARRTGAWWIFVGLPRRLLVLRPKLETQRICGVVVDVQNVFIKKGGNIVRVNELGKALINKRTHVVPVKGRHGVEVVMVVSGIIWIRGTSDFVRSSIMEIVRGIAQIVRGIVEIVRGFVGIVRGFVEIVSGFVEITRGWCGVELDVLRMAGLGYMYEWIMSSMSAVGKRWLRKDEVHCCRHNCGKLRWCFSTEFVLYV